MFLFFIRHGESEANILHVFSNRGWKHGLTRKGFQQATQLAESLSEYRFKKIYSSPLKRAAQTAKILSEKLNLEYEITDALREFDTGINEGLRDEESWLRWETVMDDWTIRHLYDSRIPGGESFNDMWQRFFPLIENICQEKKASDSNFLLIGHGGLFYCMLPYLLKLTPTQPVSLEFPNTAYVLAELTSQGLVCREWCGKSM